MSLCKHPEEVCCSMTLYHGKVYCDNANGFCQLHDEPPPVTNADHIRSLSDEEFAALWVEPFCDRRTSEQCKRIYHGDCIACVLDWLRQPYKEAEDG